MANPLAVVLHASAAETASGQGAAFDLQPLRSAARLVLEITAVSGTDTPTLAVVVETSTTGTGGWRTVATFAAATATTSQAITVADLDRFIRVRWTLTGTTPSFSFSVAGEGHVVYAGPADVKKFAMPAAALASIDPGVLAEQCIAATGEADARLPPRYTLPLQAWGDDLRTRVAQVAAYLALKHRGFNPELGTDQLVVIEKKDAESWLAKAGAGTIAPQGIVDSTPTRRGGAPRVHSRSASQWDDESSSSD